MAQRGGLALFRTALVTGASSGIGREMARQLVALGASVAMVARREAALNDAAREWTAAGSPGRAVVIPADLADPQAARRAALGAQEQLGCLDLVVNCAGVFYTGPVAETSLDRFIEMIHVNYLAAVAVTQAVLPAMRQARTGAIVNVSSMAGKVPAPFMAGYGASKFALGCFTDALREEVAGDGIRVVGVYPGPVDTPMIRDREGKGPSFRVWPLPILSPEAVARAVLAAARGGRSDVILPRFGSLSVLLGGLFPGLRARGSRLLLRELSTDGQARRMDS